MSSQEAPDSSKMVFRNTNGHAGRRLWVTPQNSTSKHLCYGRIILNASSPSVEFESGIREEALICLSGSATVDVGNVRYEFTRYDSIYIPRGSKVTVSTESEADLAEFLADVETDYPVQFVSYTESSKDPSLQFSTGGPVSSRRISVCIGRNVQAGRLLAGFTTSEPGHWTSWPPHEHSAMLEEMYVYFDMPKPAYGIQLVYNNTESPELATVVRDGDAVLMPSGYHPNVSVPGHRITFLWAMAAHREKIDRQYGVVNVQPEFNQGGSGLEASRK